MASPREPAERTPERALIALALAMIVAASTRVALPLIVLAAVVGILALPMSSLIAWLSRLDPRPPAGEDDPICTADGDPDDTPLPLTRMRTEPLPRPVRPVRACAEPVSGKNPPA